jgi:adenylate cyclase
VVYVVTVIANRHQQRSRRRGIIGTHKFSYDLWGDTVNVASRMESGGLTGEIQTTSRVRDLLIHRYAFEPRGHIEVKGKGQMETFILHGRIA